MIKQIHPTGAAGLMRIDDDTTTYVDFYLLGINAVVDQIPWTYILNGQQDTWRSFRLEANRNWQKLGSIQVDTTQTVTFKLGATGNATLGGPTDFPQLITRAAPAPVVGGQGYARINVNGVYRRAIPYVNDEGVWKPTEPWARLAGEWKPAPS